MSAPAPDELAQALKKLPGHRIFSIPIGCTLLAITLFPVQLCLFFFLGFTNGMRLNWQLFSINCQKVGEQNRKAFDSAEGFSACCACFNKYTFAFIVTNLVCILGIPFFLIIYPILGAFWACKVSAKACFRECDMAEEARTAKEAGFTARALDYMGVGDSEKEKCAESIGKNCCGYLLLVVGDWLTFTGMSEGYKTYMEGFEFQKGCLENMVKMMSGFEWLEGIGLEGYVEVDVIALTKVKSAMKRAAEIQYDIYAKSKGVANWMDWKNSSGKKKYRGCMGDFFGTISTALAIIVYLAIAMMVMWGEEELPLPPGLPPSIE